MKMSKMKNATLVTGVVLLVMAMLFGCSLLPQDGVEESGWHIKLNINHPAAAKAITVTEHDVTGLSVEVYDPEDQLIDTIVWEADEGPMSYLIPVTQEGEHKIVVTHISEENGEVVEATESNTFNIQAMIITVIDITPGFIGVINVQAGGEQPPEPPCTGLAGTWAGSNVEVPGPYYVDAVITINSDSTVESLLYEAGGGAHSWTCP